jgi:D-alanyl-D-alanine carboxypeptidase/D-alanyl-D-alanine-endopeptidase (penicillin-binding protein 4)
MLDIENMTIAEGSGISRDNQVSARQMDRILQEFMPYRHLLRREGRESYKTGTLHGISTRAGYIGSANGGLYRYVIMLNTPGKSAVPIVQRLLRILD